MLPARASSGVMLAAVSWRARPRLARLTGNLGRAEFVQKLKADMVRRRPGPFW